MRILHVMSCRGWSSDAYWAAGVCRELGREGHDVLLCCRRDRGATVIERARAEGVQRIDTLDLASGFRPTGDLRAVQELARRLEQADVVHVHRGKEHWLAAVANRLARASPPLVRTRHIVEPVRAHAGNRWLYRRATARVVAVSETIRRQYIASGLVEPGRVIALPGGVDVGRYRPDVARGPARARLGVSSGEPLVGMVGGLRVMKGHRIMVDALGALAREGVRPRVVVVGRGVMDARIRAAVRAAGLDGRVMLTGAVADMPSTMAALDIALYVPVESEGMSRVLFEYLAAGRAVVASRVGVVPEALEDGEHALLVPAGDPLPLAAAIRRLLGDAALRARLGANAWSLVEERYSAARVAARVAELYATLK